MKQPFFITSTGTDCGKTYITTALIRQARAIGKTVEAFKPIISGFDEQDFAATDTGLVIEALGLEPTSAVLDKISPWRFAAPLAPSIAARREDRAIDFEKLTTHSRNVKQTDSDLVLIEAIGGLMTPITDKHTVLDWIERANMPALLVVGSYLGSLSHSLTALEALNKRNIPLAALIVNETHEPVDETAEELKRWAGTVPVLGTRRNTKGQELRQLL